MRIYRPEKPDPEPELQWLEDLIVTICTVFVSLCALAIAAVLSVLSVLWYIFEKLLVTSGLVTRDKTTPDKPEIRYASHTYVESKCKIVPGTAGTEFPDNSQTPRISH